MLFDQKTYNPSKWKHMIRIYKKNNIAAQPGIMQSFIKSFVDWLERVLQKIDRKSIFNPTMCVRRFSTAHHRLHVWPGLQAVLQHVVSYAPVLFQDLMKCCLLPWASSQLLSSPNIVKMVQFFWKGHALKSGNIKSPITELGFLMIH